MKKVFLICLFIGTIVGTGIEMKQLPVPICYPCCWMGCGCGNSFCDCYLVQRSFINKKICMRNHYKKG